MKKAIDYIKLSYEERYKFQQYELSVLKETHHDTIAKAINTARLDVLDKLKNKVIDYGKEYVLTVHDVCALITEIKKEIE